MKKKIILNSKIGAKYKQVDFANRKHTVLSALTIEGDTVMNDIFYPIDVIKNSFESLDNLPAPAGHPSFNGSPLDPNSPVARNQFDIGAFIKDPKLTDKKVFNNIYIDEVRASESEKGKAILNKAKDGSTLGVSTGGTAKIEKKKGENYNYIVTDLKFDHVAILDGEEPAGANTYINNSDVEFIDVDLIDINKSSLTQEEEKSMDFTTSKLVDAVMQNSAFGGVSTDLEGLNESEFIDTIFANTVKKETEITFEDAKKVVEENDFRVTNHKSEDLESFDDFLKEKEERRQAEIAKRGETVSKIIKNNKNFNEKDFENMSDESLEKFSESLIKTADYSANVETVVENSEKENLKLEGL
tara:strand:+ start:15887 stop:16957 length:1071 start_codon:yes stop_codon:yes gene_type:complete